MKIEHIALWVKDLEKMKNFYVHYFNCRAGAKYINTKNRFESYFLTFTSGARLEIMQMQSIPQNINDPHKQYTGLLHFALQLESREAVDELTKRLEDDGYEVAGYPRVTGDGYYESCIFDPEMNRIELVG